MEQLLHKELSEKVLGMAFVVVPVFSFIIWKNRNYSAESKSFHAPNGCFWILHVHNILGPGLLESSYEGAYCVELARANILFERQRIYPIHYKGELVGAYIADLIVANTIILELK